jgi:PleD family two-component response regulator
MARTVAAVALADDELLAAKREGRNRVLIAV